MNSEVARTALGAYHKLSHQEQGICLIPERCNLHVEVAGHNIMYCCHVLGSGRVLVSRLCPGSSNADEIDMLADPKNRIFVSLNNKTFRALLRHKYGKRVDMSTFRDFMFDSLPVAMLYVNELHGLAPYNHEFDNDTEGALEPVDRSLRDEREILRLRRQNAVKCFDSLSAEDKLAVISQNNHTVVMDPRRQFCVHKIGGYCVISEIVGSIASIAYVIDPRNGKRISPTSLQIWCLDRQSVGKRYPRWPLRKLMFGSLAVGVLTIRKVTVPCCI